MDIQQALSRHFQELFPRDTINPPTWAGLNYTAIGIRNENDCWAEPYMRDAWQAASFIDEELKEKLPKNPKKADEIERVEIDLVALHAVTDPLCYNTIDAVEISSIARYMSFGCAYQQFVEHLANPQVPEAEILPEQADEYMKSLHDTYNIGYTLNLALCHMKLVRNNSEFESDIIERSYESLQLALNEIKGQTEINVSAFASALQHLRRRDLTETEIDEISEWMLQPYRPDLYSKLIQAAAHMRDPRAEGNEQLRLN